MILCPACQHHEIHGAIFCSNCGFQLLPENLIQEDNFDQRIFKELQDSWVSVVLLETGRILSNFSKEEIRIGRRSEGQSLLPEIDLSEFDAYNHGVSRLHCSLKRSGLSTTVVDLGSSNGTYLNGKRLDTNIETPFINGDVVSLGRFKIKLLLHFKDI